MEDKVCVSWPNDGCMSIWFYSYVIAHELGHHYVEQYKTKNKNIKNINHNEIVADIHSFRLSEDLTKKYRQKQKK